MQKSILSGAVDMGDGVGIIDIRVEKLCRVPMVVLPTHKAALVIIKVVHFKPSSLPCPLQVSQGVVCVKLFSGILYHSSHRVVLVATVAKLNNLVLSV